MEDQVTKDKATTEANRLGELHCRFFSKKLTTEQKGVLGTNAEMITEKVKEAVAKSDEYGLFMQKAGMINKRAIDVVTRKVLINSALDVDHASLQNHGCPAPRLGAVSNCLVDVVFGGWNLPKQPRLLPAVAGN